MSMQIGYTHFSVIYLMLMPLPLVTAGDNMEVNGATTEGVIHHSQSLCAGELEYVHKRKQIILEALSHLGINCSADLVPHVALLASGGGQRSAVGLVGFLYQMEKEGLLDTLLYLGGVSGSTWSMATLYSDLQWSTNMDDAVSRLSGSGLGAEEALAWLHQKAEEECFSLTDVWGVLTSVGIMKQMELRRLSEEASRDASNPYPIYSAIEKHCFTSGPAEGKWFEMSPHQAGFTELGLFIDTSLLGSRFQAGRLQEKKPERDMVQLQGVLGCALANEGTVGQFLPAWIHGAEHIDAAAEEFLRVYNILGKLLAITRSSVQDPAADSALDRLQETLEEHMNHIGPVWLESESSEQRKSLFQQWSSELLVAVETWTQSLEEGDFKRSASLLSNRILPLIIRWEWGTTRNFLHEYQGAVLPPCLYSNEKLHLIDAGLLVNVGYPAFLGDKRDIDLFIAPEYSAGDMFETLTLARDYAAEVGKPFPEIDNKVLEEKDWPRDCYVFEGKEKAPTIVFMPFFNRNNCKDADEYKAKMEEFSTFQRPFGQDKIEFVLETSKVNMKNNKDVLLREIHKAALRRQKRLSQGAGP